MRSFFAAWAKTEQQYGTMHDGTMHDGTMHDGTMQDRLTLRLAAPVILISLMFLALAGVTAWYIHKLQRDTAELLEYSVDVLRAAEELDDVARDVEARLTRFLETREAVHFDAVRPLGARMRIIVGALPLPRGAGRLVVKIRTESAGFFGEFDALARRATAERHRAVGALVEDYFRGRLRATVQDYLQSAQSDLTSARKSYQRVAGFMGIGLLVLGTCGAGAGLVLGYGVARRITRSIVQLSVPIRDVAGKLNQVVGPVNVSATRGIEEWEGVLKKISGEVESVVNKLQKSQEDALRAEQFAAVGQLAAGMAHELLNPLTAIKMIVQSGMEKGDSGDISGRDLVVLHEQIVRQERSIRSFLDFARPRTLESRPCDARRAVEEAVELADSRAKRQDVAIEWAAPEESVPIEGDVEQLGRVFLNLILNALDALPDGGVVKVTMEGGGGDGEAEEAGEFALVRVSDSGRGLPPELGERIFDPFVSTRETGMGLGLSISKRIVEMHGGTIVAANQSVDHRHADDRFTPDRPDGGAVFTVRLPLSGSTLRDGPRAGGLAYGVKTSVESE